MMRIMSRASVKQVAAGRHLTSTAQKTRNYLETWVGRPPNPSQSHMDLPTSTSNQTRPNRIKNESMRPLFLSGSSYLMPTLRLERNDTPESLSTRIEMAMEESSAPSAAVVKSMLTGKTTADGTERWRVPIVLDLGALVPDGSPHYVPPRSGLLTDVVNALSDFGISVVGITNPPSEMEKEAVKQLGLPSMLSKSRALDRQSDAKFRVQDIVQLVLSRVTEEGDGCDGTEEKRKILQDNKNIDLDAVDKTPEKNIDNSTTEGNQNGLPKESVNGTNGYDVASATDSEDVEIDTKAPILPVEASPGSARIYYGNVRSGQQIAAEKNQSLIVVGSVSSGGEVLADKDIFVLGKLRGRALAGLVSSYGAEQESARIFANSFDPELVCVGDSFTTVDNVKDLGLDQPGEAVMVSLNVDRELTFERVPLK